jgi:peptidoglycan/xylan/chitin deacetylase (PgdA/CDA1 family)
VFESSASLVVFDYFRVPYRRTEHVEESLLERVTAGGSASLLWPGESLLRDVKPAAHVVGSIPIFARLLDDPRVDALVRNLSGSWRRGEPISTNGMTKSAVWRSDEGGVLLPFDPNEAIESFWTERYVEVGAGWLMTRTASLGRAGYYRARPLLPRNMQLRLRRAFSRVQRKARFPRWPIETAVDDLFRLLLGMAAEVAGQAVPYVSFWPGDSTWAVVLTHDVERRAGYDRVDRLLEIELEQGYRSSWNFVPRNDYAVAPALLEQLRDRGFEIGVHGLLHDGRDLLARTLAQRLPAIRSYADRWEAVGFRSPATIRSARLIPLLGFDYDSSYPDTTLFEPQAGGCCTWLPYMLGRTVELPITLEQDHTLFELLGHRDATSWVEKARFLRERGGMALMITHPDYTGNRHLVDAYRSYLGEFAEDESAWKALPREVAAWWRRRAASWLEAEGSGWRVAGPAAEEGRVEFFAPKPQACALVERMTDMAGMIVSAGSDCTRANQERMWRTVGATLYAYA